MFKSEIKKRIEKLKQELNYHRRLYHTLDKQEIADAAWDSLKHELVNLEKQYPEFISADSPTQRVGGEPLKKFVKVYHSNQILSMEDIFSFEELLEWEEYMKDFLKKEQISSTQLNYFCERKIDGIDIVLTYKKGLLVRGATRGNGQVGEDVTQNIKTIEAIPLKLEETIDIVVRGEIFMTKKIFNQLVGKQKRNNLKISANPRNLTAGSIRQLDPKITASRKLDCCVFEIITDLGQTTHQQVHQILNRLGFKTDKKVKFCNDLNQAKKYYDAHLKQREKSDFEYDGVVVVLNDIDLERKLGFIGKSPRWMRAFKFPGEQATTIIKDIIIQVGRTGVLTPVAIFESTPLMGSIVSRATLHNEDEIKRLDARIGDTVIIEKAGDVIPSVVNVLENMRSGKEKKWAMPNKCPICGDNVGRKPGEVAYYCLNKKCFAAELAKIRHFVSRNGLNIEGLGPKIIAHLISQGLITDVADIFTLTRGDLESLDRFGEKSADNLIRAIDKRKKINLSRFIYALGIRHVGEETANLLSRQIKNKFFGVIKMGDFSDYFKNYSLGEFEKIPGIGPIVGQSVFEWFNDKEKSALLRKLEQVGIQVESLEQQKQNNVLSGKSFVVTGVLSTMSREQAKEKIKNLGGKVLEAISRQTDFLVCGKNPGGKYGKAGELGVKIIKEKEFITMIK